MDLKVRIQLETTGMTLKKEGYFYSLTWYSHILHVDVFFVRLFLLCVLEGARTFNVFNLGDPTWVVEVDEMQNPAQSQR